MYQQTYWQLREDSSDKTYDKILKKFPNQNLDETITIIVFNDKSLPSQLSGIAVKG